MPMECHLPVTRDAKPASWQTRKSVWSAFCLGWVLTCLAGQSGVSVLAQSVSPTNGLSMVATNAPVVPVFEVRRYEIIGNTALNSAGIEEIMRHATGTNVSLPQIRRGLIRLQEAYRERGFTKVSVTLPRQPLTD